MLWFLSFSEGYISLDHASYLSIRKTERQGVLIWTERTWGFGRSPLVHQKKELSPTEAPFEFLEEGSASTARWGTILSFDY